MKSCLGVRLLTWYFLSLYDEVKDQKRNQWSWIMGPFLLRTWFWEDYVQPCFRGILLLGCWLSIYGFFVAIEW